MAKVSLGRISVAAFAATMSALLGEKLPVRTAFKVKTLTNNFNTELKKFSEIRKEICERHCTRTEEGQPSLDDQGNYQFDEKKLSAVSSEIAELSSIEVEFTPIKLDELGDNIRLTAQQLFDIGDVLEE